MKNAILGQVKRERLRAAKTQQTNIAAVLPTVWTYLLTDLVARSLAWKQAQYFVYLKPEINPRNDKRM